MVIVTFMVVVLRYAFDVGWVWVQESVTWMHACVFMLAAAYTLACDDHVRVDIFYRDMSPRRKAIVDLAGTLLFLLPVTAFLLFTGFEYAQQPDLSCERHLSDLIQKNTRAVGLFEITGPTFDGPGVRTFLVSKQLGFDQALRNGGTVYVEHRLVPPAAQLVDRFRKQLFTNAAFPLNEDRDVGRRHLPHSVKRMSKRGRTADNSESFLN